jgi:predicted site-specific integrase-resolvase
MSAKLVPLVEWAATRYRRIPLRTLRRWAREGNFHPPAEKVGREYQVLETAERADGIGKFLPLTERI